MDISVVVTAHHEGHLAHHTIRSILRSKRFAEKANIAIEIIVVLDNPNNSTVEYFAKHPAQNMRTDNVSFADPGLARNHGIEMAQGEWIALLDADDLFGESWLANAYKAAKATNTRCVFYPEHFVCFENENYIVRSNSTQDAGFNPNNFIQYSHWNSVHFMTQRTTLINNPFYATPAGSGFGYEDWHWYCQILSKKIPVLPVRDTAVFYRKKRASSRFSLHTTEDVLIPPTELFAYPQNMAEFEQLFGQKG